MAIPFKPFLRAGRLSASLALITLLSACLSAPVHYHTLAVPLARPVTQAAPVNFMIDVLPVHVPAAADQPQLMVRNRDGSSSALYAERWAAPLAEEIRSALSDALRQALGGVMDVRVLQPAADAPVWRVQTDVQRFTLTPEVAQLDVTWRVRPINLKRAGLICHTVISEPVSEPGAVALVAAQQQALLSLADKIATVLRAQTQGQPNAAGHEACASLD